MSKDTTRSGKYNIFEYMQAFRTNIDRGSSFYTSRNSSKGALLREAETLFSYIASQNSSLDLARKAVIENNLFDKKTYQTRRRCWEVLHARYFPLKGDSLSIHPIVALFRRDVSETLRRGVLYYHFATADLFSYEATTELIYTLANQGISNIAPRDIHEFLISKIEKHPEINTWSPQTRRSLVSHYLSALRDFGILEGKVRKRIRRPPVEEDLFLYVATCLRDCGKQPRTILDSSDFKLFLLSPEEVEMKFLKAHNKGRIHFRKLGHIITLELPWSSILEYIETVG